ncbi:MAG: DNA polymerase I [Gammaproteobacteria bacterium]|nr:DNA polymerase I [Gammaproteobacteria bacterium]
MADDSSVGAPLILVDGSSYLFRAYHAMPELTTSAGDPTGAIRGVISMLRKLAKDYQGSPIAVVFDAKGKTFRNDLYADYKANRPPMPDDLREQIQPIHDIIRAMGLPLLIVADVEADDVIGTLATQATAQKRDTVVSTGDKDMAQLVSPHVSLVNTMTETTMDREGVIAKFDVTPEQIVDYLALMGDTVDNIPGVPKVGPKTAAKWLKEYGDLDTVIAQAETIKGKIGENLRASLEQLPLSRSLTQIKCDVKLDVAIGDLVATPPDESALRELFERFEFRTWLDDGASATTAEVIVQPAPITDYECISTLDALNDWLDQLRASALFAFDTETTSLNYMDAELVGFSFCIEPGRAAYLPVAHGYTGAPAQISLTAALAALTPLLEDPAIKKVGQNLKYDMSVLARYGVALNGIEFDTMLESYVLDSVASRHNMDDLAKKYLQRKTIHYEDVAGKGAKQLTFDQVPVDQATEYAAEDADVTLQLHATLWPRLAVTPSLVEVFQTIELPLLPVLSRVERTGTLIDGGLLADQSRELAERIEALRSQAFELAGCEFNPDSPKQLQEILYERLGLPVLKKTPKGQPSTAEPVMLELARDYELPEVILQYRSLAKLKSTYTDKLPLQINQKTGRVHTSYHQAVAATGRLSSSDPNLQNIPIRTAEGRRIRQAFVAPPGRKIIAADYSQIELRIMAHLSQDAGLRDAFANDQDIHRATAAEVFGTTLEAVSDDQRRNAKAINFGLIYGMSAFGLGRQLGISRTLAQDYIDRYFGRYPGVHEYMERTRALAHDQGYVETVFGRRLYLPEINARHAQRRQAAERTAINAPMQGTAADIIKRAMIGMDAWLAGAGLDALMIMQVHDELVFEVAENDTEALVSGVVEQMVTAAALSVPLIVDVGQGDNWDQAH